MLWQTAEVRLSKLRVRDEINEALRYYHSSIFETVPELLADLDATGTEQARRTGLTTGVRSSMGSWIGGDRDGNPFVTADVLRLAVDVQATTAFDHHLTALHALSRELSMSARLITPTSGARPMLADASGDDSPFRADEPYRRALRGMHARLWATAAEVLDRRARPAPSRRRCRRTRRPSELIADLDIVADSLASHGAAALARRPCDAAAPRRRDLPHPPVRARPASELRRSRTGVAELLRVAGVADDYEHLDEERSRRRPDGRAARRRPLLTPYVEYSDLGRIRAGRAAARRRRRTPGSAPEIIPHAIISKAESVSDVLEQAVLLKEVGLVRVDAETGTDHVGARHRPAVRDDHRPPRRRPHARRMLAHDRYSPDRRQPRRLAGGDGRLLRLEQGRRLPHLAVGAVPRPTRARRGRRTARRAASAVPRPGRHGRPWRRTRLSGDPRSAARLGARRTAHHRAGRDGRRQVLAAGRRRDATSRRCWRRRSRRAASTASTSAIARPSSNRRWSELAEHSALDHAIANWSTGTERFVEFFRQITPIGEIATLNVGSRPASRKSSDRIADLRAIPWVFGWSQCRLNLPGWYGAGVGVRGVCRRRRSPGDAARHARLVGRSSGRCSTTWAWCSPRPTSRSGVATPTRWWSTQPCATRSSG